MDRRKVAKTSILMMVIVVLIVGYYYYLSTRNEKANSTQAAEETASNAMTPVQELLAMAKYKEYPTTPVQVVKYYNEVTKCYYNETYSDAELEELAKLALSLCDDEFAANQSFDLYMSSLKRDIEVFKSGNITIYDAQVTPSTDVEYFEHNGDQCARLYCLYTLKSGTMYQTTREIYIMRKDLQSHWKIMGFEIYVEEE